MSDFSGDGATSTDTPPPPPTTPPSRDGKPKRKSAYARGLCYTCEAKPRRPGSRWCEDCHRTTQDSLKLMFSRLKANVIGEEPGS